MRPTSVARPARRHCQIAECSESTGTISPPPAARALATTGPAAIRLSLLASASRLPASSAASVAGRPAKPTTALSTTSASGCAASSASTSGVVEARAGEVGRDAELGACSASSSALLPGGERHDPVVVAVAAR